MLDKLACAACMGQSFVTFDFIDLAKINDLPFH
jgi:hypothetical protein